MNLWIFVLACITFGVVQGNQECQEPLGMENGEIADGQISASSELNDRHAAFQGRLNAASWTAQGSDLNIWIEVDLGNKDTIVTGVATQGNNNHAQWVTKYKLQYSGIRGYFESYKEQGEPFDKKFAGNTDGDTVVYHKLNPPIRARYIRFRPLAWNGLASMRVELYGCKETFQCPICYATGANALADCDSNIKHEVCNRHMPMCQISKKFTFSGRVKVTRHCSDKQAQDDLEQKPKCERCPQYGFCAESLCMAHMPDNLE